MDLISIIGILEPDFQRNRIGVTDYQTAISYLNINNYDLRVNTTSYENPVQVCLVGKTSGVSLYVNTIKGKYHQTSIIDIETLNVEE